MNTYHHYGYEPPAVEAGPRQWIEFWLKVAVEANARQQEAMTVDEALYHDGHTQRAIQAAADWALMSGAATVETLPDFLNRAIDNGCLCEDMP